MNLFCELFNMPMQMEDERYNSINLFVLHIAFVITYVAFPYKTSGISCRIAKREQTDYISPGFLSPNMKVKSTAYDDLKPFIADSKLLKQEQKSY